MGTPAIVCFRDRSNRDGICVRVQFDGYPAHRGVELLKFLHTLRDDWGYAAIQPAGIIAARFIGYTLNDDHDRPGPSTHPMENTRVNIVAHHVRDAGKRYVVDYVDIVDGIPSVTYEGDVDKEGTHFSGRLQDILETTENKERKDV